MVSELKSRQETAQNLLQWLPGIAQNIFRTGELQKYLDMCIHLDYLEYYNQLLVFRQFPNATLVAGRRSWEKYQEGEKEVLKSSFIRYGMDVLVPFRFESTTKDMHLSFIALKVYDISQTTIKDFQRPPSAYVPKSSIHTELLIEALKAYISNGLDRRVVYELPKKHEIQRSYPPGIITRFTLSVKENLSEYQKVLWFTEAMAYLYYQTVKKSDYSEAFETLFISCACYMLLKRWNLGHPEIYLPNKALLFSISKEHQESFFQVLQEGYRNMENTIQTLYYYFRFGGSEAFDDEDMIF